MSNVETRRVDGHNIELRWHLDIGRDNVADPFNGLAMLTWKATVDGKSFGQMILLADYLEYDELGLPRVSKQAPARHELDSETRRELKELVGDEFKAARAGRETIFPLVVNGRH
jgi:hypothetical protein